MPVLWCSWQELWEADRAGPGGSRDGVLWEDVNWGKAYRKQCPYLVLPPPPPFNPPVAENVIFGLFVAYYKITGHLR